MDIVKKIRSGNVGEVDLLEYITDNDINVAIAVAESDIATEPILDIGAHDKDRAVRLAVVKNMNTGSRTLRYLLHDSDEEISSFAKKRLVEDKE